MQAMLLERPLSMPEDIFAELAGGDYERLGKRHYLVSSVNVDNRVPRWTLTGIISYPVHGSGTLEAVLERHNPEFIRVQDPLTEGKLSADQRDIRRRRKVQKGTMGFVFSGITCVTGMPVNEGEIDALERYKGSELRFYGNIPHMGRLLYLHRDNFGADVLAFVDPFLGQGGSLIAGLEHGSVKITGIEIDEDNIRAARSNLRIYLAEKGAEFEARCGGDWDEYRVAQKDGFAEISLHRGNSLELIPQIARPGADIVSSIPGSNDKCPIYGNGATTHDNADAFYQGLAEAVSGVDGARVTFSQSRFAGLCGAMHEFARFRYSHSRDVVLYNVS